MMTRVTKKTLNRARAQSDSAKLELFGDAMQSKQADSAQAPNRSREFGFYF